LKDTTDDCKTRSWFPINNDSNNVEPAVNNLKIEWNEAIQQGNPYSGIIGFSQGSKVAQVIASIASEKRFTNLQFVVLACGYLKPITAIETSMLIKIPSLHVINKRDKCVTNEASYELVNVFQDAKVLFNESQGHCIPSDKYSLEQIADFMKSFSTTSPSASLSPPPPPKRHQKQQIQQTPIVLNEDIVEEIESLSAFLIEPSDEFTHKDLTISMRLGTYSIRSKTNKVYDHDVKIIFTLPTDYPNDESSPKVELVCANLNYSNHWQRDKKLLLAAAESISSDCIGGPAVLSVLMELRAMFEEFGIIDESTAVDGEIGDEVGDDGDTDIATTSATEDQLAEAERSGRAKGEQAQ